MKGELADIDKGGVSGVMKSPPSPPTYISANRSAMAELFPINGGGPTDTDNSSSSSNGSSSTTAAAAKLKSPGILLTSASSPGLANLINSHQIKHNTTTNNNISNSNSSKCVRSTSDIFHSPRDVPFRDLFATAIAASTSASATNLRHATRAFLNSTSNSAPRSPVSKTKGSAHGSTSEDLYAAVSKDFNLNKSLARWPAECMVMGKRIHHIRSVPPLNEVFYEVTGKEPQPRPLGDEHGLVVFNYLPDSPVNYFSRSIAAPTSDCPQEFKSDLPLLPDTLRFESRFESGNLYKAVRVTENYYELHLRPDLYTTRHCQWFYFQVTNMRSDVSYRFSIVNLSKPDSLYTCGMKPVLYSQIEAEKHFVGWSRVGTNIKYYRNDSYNDDDDFTHTLTFTLNFPHDNDTVYLAHCYPYTYTDLQEDLASIQEDEKKAEICQQRLLCRTLAGNNVYLLTITTPGTHDDLKNKPVVVLSARVHPGETPSSWILRGIIHFLVSESEVAKTLRDRIIFKIVPMLNPDGVIVGNTRCSLAARDLNRQYKSVIKEAFPPVFHLKSLIRRLVEDAGSIYLYVDLHAHSRRFNVFIYGCENRRHSEKYLKEQVFPLMLHKNTADKFSFDDCRFRIQRQKETTGRVVFWNMGIPCSYTMEASYGGTNMGSRAFTHFNTEDYEGIGRYFCETLLDFQDPCPVKEALREKIHTRLKQEGSSADDPSNIALSDYSSLSSADMSSSNDDEGPSMCGEAKKKNRRMKSRRERSRNVGAGHGVYSDFQKVHGYVKFGTPNLFMKKSDSDRALSGRGRGGKKNKGGDRRKFKRSMTMASIPASLLLEAREKEMLENSNESPCLSPRILAMRRLEARRLSQTPCGFSIGTSDESEDADGDEDREDLQKLFCPLTDSNGSPYEQDGNRLHPLFSINSGEHVSASACRQVQSEILASVSRIKSTLGKKGGLLQTCRSYTDLRREAEDGSDTEPTTSLTPIKIRLNPRAGPGDPRSQTTRSRKIKSLASSPASTAPASPDISQRSNKTKTTKKKNNISVNIPTTASSSSISPSRPSSSSSSASKVRNSLASAAAAAAAVNSAKKKWVQRSKSKSTSDQPRQQQLTAGGKAGAAGKAADKQKGKKKKKKSAAV